MIVAVGAACSLAAACGIRREALLADQVHFAVLSVAGVVLAAAGAVGWFLDGRRSVAVRASAVLAEYSVLSQLEPAGAAAGTPAAAAEGRIVVRDRDLYHRPGCPLIVDRPVTDFTHDSPSAGRYRPCPVCEP